MNEDDDALGVGFEIDFRDSFGRLRTLEDMVGEAAAKIYRDFQRLQEISGNAINARNAVAQLQTLTEGTREFSREQRRVEASGEALVRQVTRQSSEFGKSRDQIRASKIETQLLASEMMGLTEQADRLRGAQAALTAQQNAAAAAAARDAQALREAAHAHQMFEAAARRGTAAMREKEAADRAAIAAQADLAARAQRLTAEVNPAAAAQNRFNAEMSEARTLISAGAISLDDYVGKLRMERAALDVATAAHARGAVSAGAHRQAMIGVSYQLQDFMTQVSMGANPINAFAVQGAQLAGQFANIEGKAGAVARFFMGPWGLAITGAVMAIGMLTKGLLDNAGSLKTVALAADSVGSAQGVMGQMFDLTTGKIKSQNEALRLNVQLTAINLRASALAAEKEAHDAETASGQRSWSGWFAAKRPGALMQSNDTLARRNLQGVMTGKLDASEVAKWAEEANFDGVNISKQEFMTAIAKVVEVRSNRKTAELIEKSLQDGKLDAAFINATKPEKPKVDRHAESLARGAEATEAQIKNLYALAEAYKVSGAAALIAEARVKAESDAIKKRGDIESMVDRQIQVSIAQRVADAGKSAASMREQAEAQEAINALTAAGLVPASIAADLVKDQIADTPLLAAAQAAQQRGLAEEAAKATGALADQQAARERLRKAEEAARFQSMTASGNDRLAELREELRLVGATNSERNIALALVKATQEAERAFTDPALRKAYIAQQTDIARTTEQLAAAHRDYNDALNYTADKWDLIARNVQSAGQGMADAFGSAGRALGDMASIYAGYRADEERVKGIHKENMAQIAAMDDQQKRAAATQREMAKHNLATSTAQVSLYGDMASAAKGFFKQGSDGYRALQKAEQTFRAIQFALSVRAMAQDAIETASSIGKSVIRAGKYAVEAVAKAIASLPFPANIAAGAATAAALLAIGLSVGGGRGKSSVEAPNEGRGTVFGDGNAQSESIKNAIDALKEVDTVMLNYSRQMAASLKSIESQIGGFASLLVRNADSLNASGGVAQGFNPNIIGSVLGSLPLVGGILKGLFGTKTSVIGSGLYGGAQSVGDILGGGFDASYYSDVQKKKKFLGITTSNKYSTQYTGADPLLENQFTLILKSFNDAIIAAAGPLGAATGEIQQRLNGFVVNIGKIDLKGLTGAQIEEKLSAVFGAAADNMARAAFPFINEFQKVGEGAFETLVRVSSTLEAVGSSLDMLGQSAQGMGIAAKLGLADQFESVSALTSAVDAYFSAFYTKEEQAAARTAQMGSVFQSLGLAMPATLAGFRALVDAQNLNTAAGQATYATLLKLAPAFAELQSAMEGAKSAADIASERADLQRQLLELQGDTAALRALQLAKLDASNRELQQEIWAIQDAQEAAKAADELRKAWQSVGDSIADEVRRIRGLSDATGGTSFASLMGQFNAATGAARGGDMDAAKTLPQLSQALLAVAADAATSRQELDRIRAQIAASLDATNGLITGLAGTPAALTNAALLEAAAANAATTGGANDNGSASLTESLDEVRAELAQMRADNNAGHAATAANTGSIKRTLDNVTGESGGNAVSVEISAAAA